MDQSSLHQFRDLNHLDLKLLVAKHRAGGPIGRSAQIGCGDGRQASVLHALVCRTRSVTDIIGVGFSDGLVLLDCGIEAAEVRVAGPGVGAGLQDGTLAIIRSKRIMSGMRHLPVRSLA
jgi:hypothetical protein